MVELILWGLGFAIFIFVTMIVCYALYKLVEWFLNDGENLAGRCLLVIFLIIIGLVLVTIIGS